MKDFLFLSMVRWDTIFQRPQHLAMGLSRYFRVLYVDPVAYSLLGAAQNHIKGDRTRNFRPRLRKIKDNLLVYTPAPMIPFSEDYWWINEMNHSILWLSLKNLIHDIDLRDPFILVNSPYHLPLLKHLPLSSVSYDCMDQYEAFYKPQSRRRRIIFQKENELLSQIQLVFASSDMLVRRISERNKNVHLVQNGVTDLFLEQSNITLSAPPIDFPNGDGPVIGYIGAISDWFDTKAIHLLAEKHPDWRFVLIGPVVKKMDILMGMKNVFLLGIKKYDHLPAYVKYFDIATIPFILNELTVAVNPVKIYEYFALGKTVVATRLPELQRYENVCYLADGSNDFALKVEKALMDAQYCDPTIHARAVTERQEIARQNTWQQRVDFIVSTIS